MVRSFKFNGKIKGIYVNIIGHIFCSSGGVLHKSDNDQLPFIKELELDTTVCHWRQRAFTETSNGELFLGEFANVFIKKRNKFVGYIYRSIYDLNTW